MSGGTSACVAVDLLRADGATLRDSGAVDQHGVCLPPAAQYRHLTLDAWDHVTSVIGATVAGKVICRRDVGYDPAAGTGGYRGSIDDNTLSR